MTVSSEQTHKAEFQTLLLELSSGLIRSVRVEDALDSGLRSLLDFYSLGHISIWLSEEDNAQFKMAHSHSVTGVDTAVIREFLSVQFPNVSSQLAAGNKIVWGDHSHLPDLAIQEIESLRLVAGQTKFGIDRVTAGRL